MKLTYCYPITNSGTLYTTVDLLQIIPSSHTIPLFNNQHSEYHLTSFAIKPIKTFHTSRTDNLYVHVSCTYNCNCIIEYAMYCMLYNNNTDPPFPPPPILPPIFKSQIGFFLFMYDSFPIPPLSRQSRDWRYWEVQLFYIRSRLLSLYHYLQSFLKQSVLSPLCSTSAWTPVTAWLS